MIYFIVGVVCFTAGGVFGVMIMACIAASRDTEEKRKEQEEWIKQNSESWRRR